MVCSNCGKVNERNCVCRVCGLAGCEQCLDHSLPLIHQDHDNDRCKDHVKSEPVAAPAWK